MYIQRAHLIEQLYSWSDVDFIVPALPKVMSFLLIMSIYTEVTKVFSFFLKTHFLKRVHLFHCLLLTSLDFRNLGSCSWPPKAVTLYLNEYQRVNMWVYLDNLRNCLCNFANYIFFSCNFPLHFSFSDPGKKKTVLNYLLKFLALTLSL